MADALGQKDHEMQVVREQLEAASNSLKTLESSKGGADERIAQLEQR